MRKCFLYLSILTLTLSGCRTDFEVNDPWKEVNVIYALMTNKDSLNAFSITTPDSSYDMATQYFRITKMFTNNGADANSIAKISDSLYNKNWRVTLYEQSGSTVKDSFLLETTTSIPRDPGTFVSPYQILYKTPTGFRLNKDATYKIRVLDTKTGIKSTAMTNIVSSAMINPPLATYSKILFRRKQAIGFRWYPGKNARFYDLSFIIHYYEWPVNDTSAKSEKTFEWQIFRNFLTSNLLGGQEEIYTFEGGDFFIQLAAGIPVNNNVRRRMKGVEVSLAGGGEDIYTYIQANTPSSGIVQKKTDYTNVNNGYGVFSSRAVTKYFMPINSITIDTLILKPPTDVLGFVK